MLIDYHLKHALNSPHGVYAEIIEVATNHLLHLTPLRPRERLVLLDVLAYVRSLVERAALVSRALARPHRSRLPRCSHRGGHAMMGQPRSWLLIPKHRDKDTAHK